MIYVLLGLALGVALGIVTPGYIPKSYAPYFSVALMSGLDTVFGGLRAAMKTGTRTRSSCRGSLSICSWPFSSATPAPC